MILVYSHKITPRLSYIFKHIFKRVLQMQVDFTTDVEIFSAFIGPKMSYTKFPIEGEIFVHSTTLLFEQGIRDIDFKVHDWQGVPCFFSAGEESLLPYDIFAASFFLVSRYEEYYPQELDQYERYMPSDSTAVKNVFLERPVIDIWAMRFLDILKQRYPHHAFPERKYENISTINVNDAYAYKHLGLIRNITGFTKEIFQLNLDSISKRIAVLLGVRKDPYDNYEELLELSKKHGKRLIFFFLFSEYSMYDRNISFTNHGYRMMIKSITDYTSFGILFSYFSMRDAKRRAKEKNRLESVVIRPITKSRQHFNRLELPKTYQSLVEKGIKEEYTMGYHTDIGFRASTCSPFYFYDLEYEIQTPLKIFPFCVTDELMKDRQNMTPEMAKEKIKKLQEEVKAVGGTFMSIFHSYIMEDMESNPWAEVYKDMLAN